jgi:hypothetical protein
MHYNQFSAAVRCQRELRERKHCQTQDAFLVFPKDFQVSRAPGDGERLMGGQTWIKLSPFLAIDIHPQ